MIESRFVNSRTLQAFKGKDIVNGAPPINSVNGTSIDLKIGLTL